MSSSEVCEVSFPGKIDFKKKKGAIHIESVSPNKDVSRATHEM